MKTIKEYWIQKSEDSHKLSEFVQADIIEEGAQPYGSLIVDRNPYGVSFVQPMVKYEEAPSYNPLTGEIK